MRQSPSEPLLVIPYVSADAVFFPYDVPEEVGPEALRGTIPIDEATAR